MGNTAPNGWTANNYSGKNFKLMVKLDFQARESYINPDSTDFGDVNGDGTQGSLITEMTTGNGFRAIGKDSSNLPFQGNIEGNNKKIKNLYISNANDCAGLIGYATGTNQKIEKQ